MIVCIECSEIKFQESVDVDIESNEVIKSARCDVTTRDSIPIGEIFDVNEDKLKNHFGNFHDISSVKCEISQNNLSIDLQEMVLQDLPVKEVKVENEIINKEYELIDGLSKQEVKDHVFKEEIKLTDKQNILKNEVIDKHDVSKEEIELTNKNRVPKGEVNRMQFDELNVMLSQGSISNVGAISINRNDVRSENSSKVSNIANVVYRNHNGRSNSDHEILRRRKWNYVDKGANNNGNLYKVDVNSLNSGVTFGVDVRNKDIYNILGILLFVILLISIIIIIILI